MRAATRIAMNARPLISSSYLPRLSGIVAFCLLLLISEYLFHLSFRHQKRLEQSEVFNRAASLRLDIEREINTTLNLSAGLILYVAVNPDFTAEQFERIARELLHKAPNLRNVALAPDNVIRHIYPLKNNEKALGLRFMDVPEQRESVLRAIALRNTVIAGPVTLKQGGIGLISRIPIFLAGEEEKYWGIASIVINVDDFYQTCGLTEDDGLARYALRGKDSLGENGEVFFGSAELFADSEAIQLPISLPTGTWLLAAKPLAAITTFSSPLLLVSRLGGLFIAAGMGILVYALLGSYQRIQYLALHDSLTGLANRRLFFGHAKQAILTASRRQSHFAIVYIDLDNFKPINDIHGHKHGDVVLQTVAQRMQQGLRHSDITARIGGDEFILLMQDTEKTENIDNIVSKVDKLLNQPLTLDNGVTIQVEASIGAAIFPEDGTTPDALIRQADRKMYSAKTGKRR